MPLPHYQVTYAQNREDLILAGMLRKVTHGFYVDVGANHPVHDSVTKIFYDKGWSGISVEPHEHLIRELRQQRPRDINIHAGVSSQPGTLRLHSYGSKDGLSTCSAEMTRMYDFLEPASSHREAAIEVVNLAEILLKHRAMGDIHFLKIDVEGMELEVLLGNSWDRFRPWIVCLERGMFHARTAAIATFLGAWQYSPVFHDGINDYFIAAERRGTWDEYSYAQEMILGGIPLHAAFLPHLGITGSPSPVAGVQANAMQVNARSLQATNVRELLALNGEAFVRAAYANLMNRAPDPSGFEHHLAELNSGIGKATILARMRNSEEGQRNAVMLGGLRRLLLAERVRFHLTKIIGPTSAVRTGYQTLARRKN